MRRIKYTTWSGRVDLWNRMTRKEKQDQEATCRAERHDWAEVVGMGVVCMRCLTVDLDERRVA